MKNDLGRLSLSRTIATLATSAVTILILGCSPDPEPVVTTPAPPATDKPVSPTFDKDLSCRTLMNRLNADTISQTALAQTYKTERQFQRVERRDCSGRVISDKIETVQSPRANVQLSLPAPKPFQSVFVFNENSCDHKLTAMPIVNVPVFGELYAVTGDGEKAITLKGDLATALLTFELKEGLNKIFVEYHHDCRPKNIDGNVRAVVGNGTCEKSVDKTMILYPIVVQHSERLLDGTKVIEADRQNCP